MATSLSSVEGWKEYIQGRDTTFTLKIAPDMKNKHLGIPLWDRPNIRKYTPVRYAQPGMAAISRNGFNPTHSSIYMVEIENKNYYVRAACLAKPGREKLDKMKPQTFLENKYKFSDATELAETFYNSLIKQHKIFGNETIEYIKCIVSFYSCDIRKKMGFKDENEIKCMIQKNWKNWKNIVPINDISKDLSEIFGPLFVFDLKAKQKNKNYKLVGIEFPERGNFPLIDFLIHWKKNGKLVTKRYSSKSITTKSSNTIKFDLVWKEIDSWPHRRKKEFLKKWNDSWIIGSIKRMYENIMDKVPMREANLDVRRYVLSRKEIYPLVQSFADATSIKFWNEFSDIPVISDELKRFFIEFSKDTIYFVVFSIDKSTGIPKFIMDIDELQKVIVRVKENETGKRNPEQVGFEVKF